jgi:hypothetical protein
LIPSQPVFALSPYCCVLSREATNTNFIVIGLTRSRLKPTIYLTPGKHTNHYTTDAVDYFNMYVEMRELVKKKKNDMQHCSTM